MTKELDNELADATDRLLSGRELGVLAGENAELGMVVRDLYAAIAPNTPPTSAFQQRLNNRLNAEWERAHPTPTLQLLGRPAVRVAAMAAAVVLVLGALVVLAVPASPTELQGAAVALDDAAAILVLLGVALGGALVYWRGRQ